MCESLEDIVDIILVNSEKGASINYLIDDLRRAHEERLHTIDMERVFFELLQNAANESSWIPAEYMMNDWISDACSFLRTGKGVNDV